MSQMLKKDIKSKTTINKTYKTQSIMFATENCIGWKVIRLQQYNGKKQFEIKLCIKLIYKNCFYLS